MSIMELKQLLLVAMKILKNWSMVDTIKIIDINKNKCQNCHKILKKQQNFGTILPKQFNFINELIIICS